MKRIIACFLFVVVFVLPTNGAKAKARHTLTGYLSEIAISPNGKFVACGIEKSAIQLWDVKRGTLYRNLLNSSYETPQVWTQNGNYLITQYHRKYKDGKYFQQYHVCVRQMPSGKVVQIFPNMHGVIWSDGEIIRVTNGITVRTWCISNGALLYGHLLAPPTTPSTPRVPLGNLAFSQNGKFLVREGLSYATVWDASTGKILHNMKKAHTLASYVDIGAELAAISNNGRHLVLQGENPNWKLPFDEWGELCQRPSCYNRELTLELWDLDTHKKIRVWRGYFGDPGASLLQFSNDSKTLYTGDGYDKSRIYDVHSGKEEHVNFRGTQAISQNDKFWAFGYDHIIHIISVKTGKVIGTVPKP